jgi:hypothetical protein
MPDTQIKFVNPRTGEVQTLCNVRFEK